MKSQARKLALIVVLFGGGVATSANAQVQAGADNVTCFGAVTYCACADNMARPASCSSPNVRYRLLSEFGCIQTTAANCTSFSASNFNNPQTCDANKVGTFKLGSFRDRSTFRPPSNSSVVVQGRTITKTITTCNVQYIGGNRNSGPLFTLTQSNGNNFRVTKQP